VKSAGNRPSVGDLIKEGRDATGLSINELAKTLDLDPGYIWKLEKGERGARIGTIKAIADILGRPRFPFLEAAGKINLEHAPEIDRGIIINAINAGIFDIESRKALARVRHLIDLVEEKFIFNLSRSLIEEKARRILQHYSTEFETKISLPIPVLHIARLFCELTVSYDKNISSWGQLSPVTGEVFLNSSRFHTPEIQRFTLGHELGHLFLSIYDDFLFEPKSHSDVQVREIEANQFSSSLLMPAKTVKYFANFLQLGDPIARSKLAQLFCVSTEAMEKRLLELRYISNSKIIKERRKYPIRERHEALSKGAYVNCFAFTGVTR
jgi:Zn-dependent peptidase ImmA (M78 family)